MSAILIFAGAALLVFALALQANRMGYVYFVIGPRAILVIALALGVLALTFKARAETRQLSFPIVSKFVNAPSPPRPVQRLIKVRRSPE